MHRIIISEDQAYGIQNMMSPAVDEVSPEEVDTKPFEYKGELNPDLWDGDTLKHEIRDKLLSLADDFLDTMSISWVKPEDIILTGSMANYNWNKYSDIDVHILMDYSDIHENKDFVRDYIESKKAEWAEEHDSLNIKSFPVEMYVEDSGDKSDPSGCYSLTDDKWIRKPVDGEDSEFNSRLVREKASEIMTKIDDLSDKHDDNKDDDKTSKEVYETLHSLLKKLSSMRKEALKTEKKEMSTGNIIYKVVKHSGHIKKAWDTLNSCYDRMNSIR